MDLALIFHLVLIIPLSSILFLSEYAVARGDLIPGSRYTSARAAAMGDAYLPLGNDIPSGLFYNPADLGRFRKFVAEPINFSFYINQPAASAIGSNTAKLPSLSGYLPTLQASPSSQMSGSGGAIFAGIGMPGFAVGILSQVETAGRVNTDGTVTYRSLYQIIPTMGFGARMFNGLFRMGYSFQWVNTSIGMPTVNPSDSIGYNQNLQRGSALSHNFGASLIFPVKTLPSLDFVARNIGIAKYNSSASLTSALTTQPVGTPSDEPMTFDGAMSFHPRLGWGVTGHLVFEDRDMTNQSGVDLMGHLAMGIELDFSEKFFLRGGMGSGYWNGGLGLKRKGAELSLTYTTIEVGTHYLDQGDTRFLLQYQMRSF
jgi:hypothetical protein